mmetsp:Transcript_29659/g.94901  ORF Transcript_29659/g.94901 Transcript_29659/m.94901 type:complete len:263 (-) Transcript_29659:61-849(-)
MAVPFFCYVGGRHRAEGRDAHRTRACSEPHAEARPTAQRCGEGDASPLSAAGVTGVRLIGLMRTLAAPSSATAHRPLGESKACSLPTAPLRSARTCSPQSVTRRPGRRTGPSSGSSASPPSSPPAPAAASPGSSRRDHSMKPRDSVQSHTSPSAVTAVAMEAPSEIERTALPLSGRRGAGSRRTPPRTCGGASSSRLASDPPQRSTHPSASMAAFASFVAATCTIRSSPSTGWGGALGMSDTSPHCQTRPPPFPAERRARVW